MSATPATLNTELPGWAASFYTAVDSFDLDGMIAHFTDDVRVRFGNGDVLVGHDAFKAQVLGLGEFIGGMKHSFSQAWEAQNDAVLVCNVDYTKHDGRIVSLPAVITFHLTDGLIDDMRILIDMTPVFG